MAPDPAPGEQQAFEVRHGRRPQALVVDDSTSALAILERMLEGDGIAMIGATDGDQAFDIATRRGRDFDLVLMDLVMEASDGVQVIRRIRPLLAPGCAIVAMTASPSDEVAAECERAGATPPLLLKPFRKAEVLRRVRLALNGVPAAPAASAVAPITLVPIASPTFAERPALRLADALDRCGGDVDWLRAMLERLGIEGPQTLRSARLAWREGRIEVSRKRLNRLRGDLMNLGMDRLAQAMTEIEEALRAIPDGTPIDCECGASKADEPDCLNSRIDRVFADLLKVLREALDSPALRQVEAAPAPSAEVQPAAGPGFADFVRAMVDRDAQVFRLAPMRPRLLPARYPDAVEQVFRRHFDALEFDAALQLLDAADRQGGESTTSADAGAGYRLLVACDAPLTLGLLCRTLEGMGQVRFALSPAAALDAARAWGPHLMLVDADGHAAEAIELCRTVKADVRTSAAAMILISSDHDVALEVAALTAGAADFIEKPLNPARVVGRVSTQLNAARRLAEAEQLAGRDLRNAPIGFLTCTLDGTVIEANPSLAGWLGRASRNVIGQPLSRLLAFADGAPVADYLGGLAQEGRSSPQAARLQVEGRSPIPVRVMGWTAPGAPGRIAWIAMEDMRDRLVEERRRIDEKMSMAVLSLCGGIAHEFNNLLNVTIGNLDLVIETEQRAQQRRRLTEANTAALRAADISRRLSRAARRLRGGTMTASLDQLIDEIWPLLLGSLAPGVRLERAASGAALPVLLDPDGLRGSLVHLLRNACDAMPEGGRITLRTAGDTDGDGQQRAVLEVIDNGPGMDAHTREHAFEPFFTTRQPERTGLGLSEVSGFVWRHGGHAEIDSAPAAGTTVRLTFPVFA